MMAPFTVFFSPGFHLPKTFHVFGSDLSVDVVRCRQWLRLSSVNGLLVFGFHCCLRWLFLRSLPSPEPTYRLCFSSPHPSCFCATQKQPPPSSDDEAQAELSDDAGGDVPDADHEAWSPGDDGEEGGQEGGEEDQAATDLAVPKRVTRATAITTATAPLPVTSNKKLLVAGDKAHERDRHNPGKSSSQIDGTAAVFGATNPKPVNEEDAMVMKATGGKDPHISIYLVSYSSSFLNSQ